MFAMQHSTRILFCRLGFVVFCLVPTVAVSGWIALRTVGGTSAQKAEWERELNGRLGLIVEIGQLGYPHPNLARLTDVRLLDPETRSLFASAAMIEISPTTDGWNVAAVAPRIESQQLGRLTAVLESRLLRGPSSPDVSVSLMPCELTLSGPAVEQTLRILQGKFIRTEKDTKLTADLLLPGAPSQTQPARWIVCRDRTQTPLVTIWQLETGNCAWPCGLIRDVAPAVSRLGERCRFTGRLALVDAAGSKSGSLSGTLQDVDLDAVVSEQLSHALSGLATLRIERVVLQRDKLVELRGTLRAQNGAISRSLVDAAAEHLQLSGLPPAQAGLSAAVVPFRQLAVGFQLDGSTLSLTGSADPTQDGVLLANAAGPILTAGPRHAVPAVNLLRTVLPGSEYQVPATRQTSALVNLLPVPDVVPAAATVPLPNHTPTRLMPAASPQPGPAVRQPAMR
jgi:hypothetical protein